MKKILIIAYAFPPYQGIGTERTLKFIKYLPKFNIRLTDDKDYLYIGITKEDFPKVLTLRKQDLKKVKKFFF
ncbi:MAG: hypothetical protein HYU63_00550 [Armatimonadetes bacterium]|nr:hypothetical protein [Armatimonadota bacterium]